jgi:hypothetical protein
VLTYGLTRIRHAIESLNGVKFRRQVTPSPTPSLVASVGMKGILFSIGVIQHGITAANPSAEKIFHHILQWRGEILHTSTF